MYRQKQITHFVWYHEIAQNNENTNQLKQSITKN